MKTMILRYTTGLIPFIALATCAYAQNSESNNLIVESTHAIAKVGNMPIAKSASDIAISSKAEKNFNKTYKQTGNVIWFVMHDGYMAQFKEDGINTKVYYDRKGNNKGNIRSYSEDKLPKEIRHLVRSKYYDYRIYFAQEVNVDAKKAFLVYVEDEKSFKTIRVIDGEMDEFKAFAKAN